MKKILIILMLALAGMAFGQNSCYSYKVKLQGIDNPEKAKRPIEYMRILFKTNPVFNDSVDQFEFTSSIPFAENGFRYMMHDDGYVVLFFDKIVCVATEQNGQIIYKEEGDN
jgi:hypothetical protein